MTQPPDTSPERAANDCDAQVPLRDRLVDAFGDDELLFLDPPSLDIAIVGIAERLNLPPVVVYDRQKLLEAFVAEGMSDDDAEEWISYNVERSYVGERTPLLQVSVESLLQNQG